MFGYFIGLFWGLIFGCVIGLTYNFISTITKSYYKEKNPKKILMKKIYEQLSDRVFEQFYEDIESVINIKNIQFDGIPKIEEIVSFTHNIMDIAKYYNNKFTIVYDNKNDKTIKIKILDGALMNDKNFMETMKFLTKNNINVCIILPLPLSGLGPPEPENEKTEVLLETI